MRTTRGGRLVIGIGCWLLAAIVWGTLRAWGLHLTEGELLLAYWPGWLLVVALASAGAVLIGGEIR